MNNNMIYIDKICYNNCLLKTTKCFERVVWYICVRAHRVDFDV